MVPLVYNSSAGVLAAAALTDRLFRRLGVAEVQETICAATAGAAWDLVFGGMLSADPHDVVHARHVVVWGANPTVSNTHLPPLVQQARAAGARLTVIDPRRTAMAARADRHLAPLPGTDVVLALAVARHLRSEGLLDERFLAEHASGVDEHLAAAEPWTLARAAGVCGRAGRRHRRVRRGLRRPTPVVPARRLGHRAQPQRRRRVPCRARPPGAGRSLRSDRQWRHDESLGCRTPVDAPGRP